MTESQIATILEKLKYITETIKSIDHTVTELRNDSFARWEAHGKEYIQVKSDVEDHEKKLAHLDVCMSLMQKDQVNLQNKIGPLLVMHRVLVWIAVVLGGSVIALLWSLLIGVISIVQV